MEDYSQIKKEANNFLNTTSIVKELSAFGKVEIVGSYKLDLMVQKDLDFYVINNKLPKFNDLSKFINHFIQIQQVYYQKFEDNQELIKPDLPKGIYLGFKIKQSWKLDIWFLSELEARSREKITQEVFRNFDIIKHRDLIIKLKAEAINSGVYNKKFSSLDLYKEVILNNKTTLDEILKKN